MDCSPPGSSVHGIFQARVLEWGAIAFSAPSLLPDLKYRLTTVVSGHSEGLGCPPPPICHPGDPLTSQIHVSSSDSLFPSLNPLLIITFYYVLQFPVGTSSLMLAVLKLAAFRQNILSAEISLKIFSYITFIFPLPLVFMRFSQ